tara:strand:+ start:1089 stop:1250 length:162 start_codon:yes stop_codon:yes gene_type:complete
MKLFLFLATMIFLGACSVQPIATVEPVEETAVPVEAVEAVKTAKACINTNTCK